MPWPRGYQPGRSAPGGPAQFRRNGTDEGRTSRSPQRALDGEPAARLPVRRGFAGARSGIRRRYHRIAGSRYRRQLGDVQYRGHSSVEAASFPRAGAHGKGMGNASGADQRHHYFYFSGLEAADRYLRGVVGRVRYQGRIDDRKLSRAHFGQAGFGRLLSGVRRAASNRADLRKGRRSAGSGAGGGAEPRILAIAIRGGSRHFETRSGARWCTAQDYRGAAGGQFRSRRSCLLEADDLRAGTTESRPALAEPHWASARRREPGAGASQDDCAAGQAQRCDLPERLGLRGGSFREVAGWGYPAPIDLPGIWSGADGAAHRLRERSEPVAGQRRDPAEGDGP